MNRVSEPRESVFPFGELQRFLAVCADAASSTRVDLGAIWQELLRGQSVIVDHFFIHDRCFAALQPLRQSAQPESRVVLKAHAESPILERSLLELAADAGAAEVPLLLVMAHHAFHHGGIEAQLSELVHDGVAFRIVGVQRPDARLSDTLNAAELEIARLSVEGRTLREIAVRARTSEEDAKSRLYSAFEKLGVESRVELLQKLVREPKARSEK